MRSSSRRQSTIRQPPIGCNVAQAGSPSLALPGRRASRTAPACAFFSKSEGSRWMSILARRLHSDGCCPACSPIAT